MRYTFEWCFLGFGARVCCVGLMFGWVFYIILVTFNLLVLCGFLFYALMLGWFVVVVSVASGFPMVFCCILVVVELLVDLLHTLEFLCLFTDGLSLGFVCCLVNYGGCCFCVLGIVDLLTEGFGCVVVGRVWFCGVWWCYLWFVGFCLG